MGKTRPEYKTAVRKPEDQNLLRYLRTDGIIILKTYLKIRWDDVGMIQLAP